MSGYVRSNTRSNPRSKYGKQSLRLRYRGKGKYKSSKIRSNNLTSRRQVPYYSIKGRKWYYYYLSQRNSSNVGTRVGLLDEYNEEQLKKGLVVQCTPPKLHLFSYFNSIIEFLQYEAQFPMEERGFFETVLGQCEQKPHFDLDVNLIESATKLETIKDKTTDEIMSDMIIYIIFSISKAFEIMNRELNLSKDVLIFTSHGENKRSYHIVIDNHCHSNCEEANRFYQVVLQNVPEVFHQWIDHSVYKSLQQFRMEGSQKIRSGRIKKLETEWVYGSQLIKTDINDHRKTLNDLSEEDRGMLWNEESIERYIRLHASLLMNTNHCRVLPDFIALLPIENYILPNEYTNGIDDELALNSVQLLAETMGYNIHSDTFPFSFNKVVSGGIILLKRKRSSYCSICERTHENENPYMYIVNNTAYFDCRRNDRGLRLKIGKLNNESSDNSNEDLTSDNSMINEQTSADSSVDMNFTIPTVDTNGQILDNTKIDSSKINMDNNCKSEDILKQLSDMSRGIDIGTRSKKNHRFIRQHEN